MPNGQSPNTTLHAHFALVWERLGLSESLESLRGHSLVVSDVAISGDSITVCGCARDMSPDSRFPQISDSTRCGTICVSDSGMPCVERATARYLKTEVTSSVPRSPAAERPPCSKSESARAHAGRKKIAKLSASSARAIWREGRLLLLLRGNRGKPKLLMLPSVPLPIFIEKHWPASLANAVSDAALSQCFRRAVPEELLTQDVRRSRSRASTRSRQYRRPARLLPCLLRHQPASCKRVEVYTVLPRYPFSSCARDPIKTARHFRRPPSAQTCIRRATRKRLLDTDPVHERTGGGRRYYLAIFEGIY
eukprot:IDg929t1